MDVESCNEPAFRGQDTGVGVWFGSKADIRSEKHDVRSTPKADIAECKWDVRFVPKRTFASGP